MDNNKRMNLIKGIVGGLILLLGIGVIIGYKYGLFYGSIPWVIITIVCSTVVLLISGLLLLPRARIQRTSRTYEFRTDQHNREYHETVQRRESRDFTPTPKYNQKSSEVARFCNYCGVNLQKGTRICSNCGQNLD